MKYGELPNPEWDGHDFLGWFTEKENGEQITTNYTPSQNITVFAHWKIRKYTITFDANGGTAISNNTRIIEHGSSIR